MKIGVLSDTHNHLREARRALDVLLAAGAEHLVHCGDVGEDVLDLLAATCLERGIRAHVAIGNCDMPGGGDIRFAPTPASIQRGHFLEWETEGKRCAVAHGHHPRPLAESIAAGRFDYVFVGHSHARMDETLAGARVLNPGSCSRPRDGLAPSVLLLDPATGEAAWLPVHA